MIIATLLQVIAFGLVVFFVLSLALKLFFKKHISRYFMFMTSLASVNLLHRFFSAVAEYFISKQRDAFIDIIVNPIRYYDTILPTNPWVGGTGLFLWWLLCLSLAGFLVETYILDFFGRKNDNFLRVFLSLFLSYALLNFFGGGLENLNSIVGCFFVRTYVWWIVFFVVVAFYYYDFGSKIRKFIEKYFSSKEKWETVSFPVDSVSIEDVEYDGSYICDTFPVGVILYSEDEDIYIMSKDRRTILQVIENKEKGKKFVIKWKIK